MKNNIGKAIACFKELGLRPKLDSFKDKLVMQKVVYLLQRLEVDAGFSYGLYVRGPYSPALTKTLYENKQKVEKLETATALSKSELHKIGELANALDVSNAAVLETTATFACLKFEKGLSEDSAMQKLRELKPFYSEAQLALGASKAKQLFFKPTEEDLRSLREESRAWEEASDEALRLWG